MTTKGSTMGFQFIPVEVSTVGGTNAPDTRYIALRVQSYYLIFVLQHASC